MKKIYVQVCLACFFALFSFSASAQSFFTLGVKGGISIPNLSGGNNPLSQGYSSRLGPYAGFSGNFRVSNLFSIQPELVFTGQGGKKNNASTTMQIPASAFNPEAPDGVYIYEISKYNNRSPLNYIELPVLAKFTFGNGKFKYFVDAGPYMGYLVAAKQVTKGTYQVYEDQAGTMPISAPGASGNVDTTSNIKSDLKKINIGLQGGIGVSQKVGGGDIFLDAHFELGLTNLQKDTEENGKNHTGAVVVALGYEFGFGSRKK